MVYPTIQLHATHNCIMYYVARGLTQGSVKMNVKYCNETAICHCKENEYRWIQS